MKLPEFHPLILIFFILTFSLNINGQNAYYDALKIEYLSKNHFTKLKAHKADFDRDSVALKSELESSSAFRMSSMPTNTPFTKIIEKYKKDYSADYNRKSTDIQKLNNSLTKAQEKYINIIPDIDNFNSFINSPFTSPPLNDKTLRAIRKAVVINEEGVIGIETQLAKVAGLQNSSLVNQGFLSIPVSAQSTIIDGTAKFLAERFKEDITTLYIDKFRKKLDEIEELKGLYPKTHSFLKTANVFDYRSLGNDFKEAFEEDLKNVLVNLSNYVENTDGLSSNLKNKGVYYPLDFALQLSDKLIKGYHPIEILDFLENRYENHPDAAAFKSYYNVIHGMNLLQYNIQRRKVDDVDYVLNKQFENIWLRFKDLKRLDSDKKIELFAAMIYHQDPVYFSTVLKIDITGIAGGVASGKKFLNEVIYPALEILNTIENLQSKGKDMTADDYVDIMSNTLSLIKHINGKEESAERLPQISGFAVIGRNNQQKIDLFEFIDKIVDLYKSVQSKEYGYVVTNSLYLTENVLLAAGLSNSKVVKVTQAVNKYGGFMVDIVTADDSDQVKEAIKRNVTKFSYLDKRSSRFSITVSAHPGIYGGFEQLKTNDETEANFGITAPIGFEFAIATAKEGYAKNESNFIVDDNKIKHRKGSSWSIFASFADIGAAFNYRLNDPESDLPEELTFKQIFSPGISLNHGFRNSPVTIGAGIQYTPELRKVTANAIETSSNSLRFMIRLSWDIPLIKIYGTDN
ncbi:hypothetical protein [Flagellimonas sp. 2504JD4-2]